MKFNEDTIKAFLEFTQKERTLDAVCNKLEMSELEVLGLVSYIRKKGTNIVIRNNFDKISMINMGDKKLQKKKTQQFYTDESNEIKFILISDTRLGSKYQQLSILNDIYKKGYEMGYHNVLLCGNISAGLYKIKDIYSETNFINDTYGQIDYIIKNYPKVEGMKTYFITGTVDDKHLSMENISIGKRISEVRDDMVFLGENSCDIKIDNVTMKLLCNKLSKTYTVSYRTQQHVGSIRSEDKPDIFAHGGLLQADKFKYRNVHCLSVPSVCATTKEMNEKRYANTIGAWYMTITVDEKGLLKDCKSLLSPYYVTEENDYLNSKQLKINAQEEGKKLVKKRGNK